MNRSIIVLGTDDVPNDIRVWRFKDRKHMLIAYQLAWEAIQKYCKSTGAELE